MHKFATLSIIEAQTAQTGRGLMKDAHRAAFQYDPQPGMVYVRSRAISSRCNDNFDEFPAEEIAAAYLSFVGKPVFVNHHNENHRRARGVIVAAVLHEDSNPDGSPDTWVEVLMEVDAINFPLLAEKILTCVCGHRHGTSQCSDCGCQQFEGQVNKTSMGCDVAYSKCSYCGNKAVSPLEYCQHVRRHKGRRIRRRNAATGNNEDVLVREICYGLRFFENSILVEDPADPTAFFLGVESGDDLVASARKTAAAQVAKTSLSTDGMETLMEAVRDNSEVEILAQGNPGMYHTRKGFVVGGNAATVILSDRPDKPISWSDIGNVRLALSVTKDEVATLIDNLAGRLNDAKFSGVIDLCEVTVAGTNLFCGGNKGISRHHMPQLTDEGGLDLGAMFAQEMMDSGHKVTRERVLASSLKASQGEINGEKIASMVESLKTGRDFGGMGKSLFISHDGYIVDGHHRWAAMVCYDLLDGDANDVKVDVVRIDMDIIELLDKANEFAARHGSSQRGFHARLAYERKTRTPEWDQEDEDLHPRGEGGKWGDGNGGGAAPKADEQEAPAADGIDWAAVEQHQPHPSTKGTGSEDDPVDTESIEDAAVALALGYHVQLHQPKQVSTLLDRLSSMVGEAKAKGEALHIDLCNVTVAGTNLFCSESKGIPRVKMPQLKVPKVEPGSRAETEVAPNEKGEYDLQPLFLEALKGMGYEAEETTELAANLRATQNELNGGKVAGMTDKLLGGGSLGDEPIFVSDDDYIVDGHHRWAANVAADYADGDASDMAMSVWRINIDIITLLDLANKFATEYGAPQASVTAKKKTPCLGCGESKVAKVGQPGFLERAEFEVLWAKVSEKVARVPRPTQEQIERNRQQMASSERAGGDFRGNSYDRRRRSQALLAEFGDGRICGCWNCGRVLDASTLEEDKIHTGAQGGRYIMANLLPICRQCNVQRNDNQIAASKVAFTGSLWRTRSTGYYHRSMNCQHIRGEIVDPAPVEDLSEAAMVASFGAKACSTCFPSAPRRTGPARVAGYLEWTSDPHDDSLWWQDGPDGEPHIQIVVSQRLDRWWYEITAYDADFMATHLSDGGPFGTVDEAERRGRADARRYAPLPVRAVRGVKRTVARAVRAAAHYKRGDVIGWSDDRGWHLGTVTQAKDGTPKTVVEFGQKGRVAFDFPEHYVAYQQWFSDASRAEMEAAYPGPFSSKEEVTRWALPFTVMQRNDQTPGEVYRYMDPWTRKYVDRMKALYPPHGFPTS